MAALPRIRSHQLWLLAGAALLFAVFLFSVRERLVQPHFDEWDEYLTAVRSKEMVEMRSWPVPMRNREHSLAKPPLQYMLTGLCMEAGIDQTLSVRIAPLFFGLGLAITTVFLIPAPIEWSPLRRTLWSAAVFGTVYALPVYRYHTTSGFLDTGQTFFIILMACIVPGLRNRTRNWYLLGLIAGVGTWEKSTLLLSLVFIIMVVIELGFECFDQRRWSRLLHAVGAGMIVGACALAIPVSFYVSEGISFGTFFGTFSQEMSQRVSTEELPFWKYLNHQIVVFGWLFVPGAIALVWTGMTGLKSRQTLRVSLCAIAVIGSVGLYHSTKISHRYGLPVVIVLAIIVLMTSRDFLQKWPRRWSLGWLAFVIGCLIHLNFIAPLKVFLPAYAPGTYATYAVLPTIKEVLNEENELVVCYSREAPWPIVHAEVLLFHIEQFPKEKRLRHLILPDHILARRPEIPEHCIGVIHRENLALFQRFYPEASILDRYEHLVIWQR